MPKISGNSKPKQIDWKWEFPNDFCIIIDTRENQMLFKRPPKGLLTVRDKLEVGDYSIKGFESNITVERKNLDDFLQSISSGHKDFTKRLERMNLYERKYLLIESTESDLLSLQPQLYSKIHPNVIRGALASIWGKYNVPIYFAETRRHAERFILDTFLKYYKWKREIK